MSLKYKGGLAARYASKKRERERQKIVLFLGDVTTLGLFFFELTYDVYS